MSRYRNVALRLRLFLTPSLHVQIVGMLIDPLDCIAEPSLAESSAASADSGDWVMEAAPDVVCLDPFHLVLASAST